MTEQSAIVKEEKNKTVVIVALFCSILLPPIGFILGVIELIRARKFSGLRTLAIVAILMSIATSWLYIHTFMDNNSFQNKITHTERIN